MDCHWCILAEVVHHYVYRPWSVRHEDSPNSKTYEEKKMHTHINCNDDVATIEIRLDRPAPPSVRCRLFSPGNWPYCRDNPNGIVAPVIDTHSNSTENGSKKKKN